MARDIWCKGSCLRSFAIICNNQFKLAKKIGLGFILRWSRSGGQNWPDGLHLSQVMLFLLLHFYNLHQKPIKTRLTKCTFHKFGSSGELEKHDALCILPINIFNEKIYIFLWFWMLILGALTALVVVYRFALCISSSLRTYLFKLRYRKWEQLQHLHRECYDALSRWGMLINDHPADHHYDQDQAGVRGAGDGEDSSWGLVPSLSPWTEHWSHRF